MSSGEEDRFQSPAMQFLDQEPRPHEQLSVSASSTSYFSSNPPSTPSQSLIAPNPPPSLALMASNSPPVPPVPQPLSTINPPFQARSAFTSQPPPPQLDMIIMEKRHGTFSHRGAESTETELDRIERQKITVGQRKALVYYNGKAPKGEKTNWIMHEFRLDDPPLHVRNNRDDMRLDDCVLCMIYKKRGKRTNADTTVRVQQSNEENSFIDDNRRLIQADSQMLVTLYTLQASPIPGLEEAFGTPAPMDFFNSEDWFYTQMEQRDEFLMSPANSSQYYNIPDQFVNLYPTMPTNLLTNPSPLVNIFPMNTAPAYGSLPPMSTAPLTAPLRPANPASTHPTSEMMNVAPNHPGQPPQHR
ncbi:putative proteinC DOMAIN-CONTAINING PROTEIN 102-LIKE [Salix koriyanagi]|uniref:NAC domain-containing protein n=1 Tax=Salix koriyanagi TaxID=2511006 RepID=A0A9Q1AND2_9ROSI|nr:putative proteinC DOMAIN-CONTAINING PROTEIN 102-LIKE [Salix koriyanagi]